MNLQSNCFISCTAANIRRPWPNFKFNNFNSTFVFKKDNDNGDFIFLSSNSCLHSTQSIEFKKLSIELYFKIIDLSNFISSIILKKNLLLIRVYATNLKI